jgi:hypothetical protein
MNAAIKNAIINEEYTKVPSRLTEWAYGRTTKFIKRNTLKRDIARGVKFLSEGSYSNVLGSTKSSALFCLALKKHIDFSLVYRADFKHNNKHWYTVTLHFRNGYVVQLKGFSFGYWGEGSRGSMAILKDCGFKDWQIEKLFVHHYQKNLRFFRRNV